MDMELTVHEARVLGSLIEKELTTPEYYPLTMNALVLACNQKSNRDPVVTLTTQEVTTAIEGLRSKHLAWRRSIAGDRVSKYDHNMTTLWSLSLHQTVLLCELLLRGPQTLGELKTHAKRMVEFSTIDEVGQVVQSLANHTAGPFTCELERMPGQKEARFSHLLCGRPTQPEAAPIAEERDDGPSAVSPAAPSTAMRLQTLEETIAQLAGELAALRGAFEDFKNKFE